MKAFASGLTAALISLACLGGSADAADFYSGKIISIMTGGSTGRSYDTHSRVLAAHMGKHIPGNPTFIVQNNPAGFGVAAANHVFNNARKDGTELGQFNRDAIIQALLGTDTTIFKFKVDEFNWLGSPGSYSDNAYLILIRGALPYKGIEDIQKAKAQIIFGNKGETLVVLAKEVFMPSVKIIAGYQGNVINLALERGEIDGVGTGYGNVVRETPNWFKDNVARPIIQFGHDERLAALPDVPTARELAKNADDLALIKFAELSLVLGFPFTAPPGIPAERLAILRQAFNETMSDPDYIAAIRKAEMEYSPQTGAQLLATILEATKAPRAVLERYKALTAGG